MPRGTTLYQTAQQYRTEEEKNAVRPLFTEKWSKIFPGQLVVRRFFFPSAVCKRIETKEIKAIYYRIVALYLILPIKKQDYPSTMSDVRVWGMALFCGWAFDIMRGFRKNAGARGFYNVAVDVEGEEKMTGFTTTQLAPFVAVIKSQCNMNVVIKEGFPWDQSKSELTD